MINYKRIKEICGYLDAEVYGKGCNFLNEDEDEISFYSRDYCHDISFEDLIEWYIKRISYTDSEIDEDTNTSFDAIDKNVNLLMELIKIYSIYNVVNKIKTLI